MYSLKRYVAWSFSIFNSNDKIKLSDNSVNTTTSLNNNVSIYSSPTENNKSIPLNTHQSHNNKSISESEKVNIENPDEQVRVEINTVALRNGSAKSESKSLQTTSQSVST